MDAAAVLVLVKVSAFVPAKVFHAHVCAQLLLSIELVVVAASRPERVVLPSEPQVEPLQP